MTYKIVRIYSATARRKTIRRGLSLAEAQAWCSRPDTRRVGIKSGQTIWMDCFYREVAS